ncbi:PIN domain-containing protein [Escherichia marmotae]|nr:PIN domain-containing protein [Escherichia marmotae]
MKILIDTNIFYNSYYIKSANLRLILNYINNEGHVLLLSDIVLKEVEKHFQNKYKEAEKNLVSALKIYNNFLPLGDEVSLDGHIISKDLFNPRDYSFLSQIYKYVDEKKVIKIESDKVPHHLICEKAFNVKKPFKENGSGYKDCLIWLSFLNYLVENKIEDEEVAFVSNNVCDFSETKKRNVLHKDLIDDIESLKVRANIKYFCSISELVEFYSINKDEYSTSYKEVERYIENYFFDDCLEVFNSFFKDKENIKNTHGREHVSLLFEADIVYMENLSKVKVDIIQIESNEFGISCRCRLDYSHVEVKLIFFKDDINFLLNSERFYSWINGDDDTCVNKNCAMQIETTFMYKPEKNKEYEEQHGCITDISIQSINLDWFL